MIQQRPTVYRGDRESSTDIRMARTREMRSMATPFRRSLVVSRWAAAVALLALVALTGPACSRDAPDHAILTWEAVPGVTGYHVYRSEQPGGEYARITEAPVREPRYTDTDVRSGVTYYYRVTAVSASGRESEFSEERSKTVR